VSYQISFTVDDKLLICVVQGERNYNKSINLWKQILEQVNDNNIEFLLLELHMTGRFLPNENLGITQVLIEMIKPLTLTIALVDTQAESFHDNYIAGVIAKQQNISIKIFHDLETAQLWINAQI